MLDSPDEPAAALVSEPPITPLGTEEHHCRPCDVRVTPTKFFRRFVYKKSFRFVPEYAVSCRHGRYACTHVLHSTNGYVGGTDVCVYTRQDDSLLGCPCELVVKSIGRLDAQSEADNVHIINKANQSHHFFVNAAVAYSPLFFSESTNEEGPESYTVIVMQALECNLREAPLPTLDSKLAVFRRVTQHVSTLWNVLGLAYLDMKAVNVLVTTMAPEGCDVVMCDHGALSARGTECGSATYPPPTEPSGLDVPATEANVCWGLGVLLVTMLDPQIEVVFRFNARATRCQPTLYAISSRRLLRSMQNARGHFKLHYPPAVQNALDTCWRSFISPSPSRLSDVLAATYA
jgi:hypothetical protein